MKIEIKSRQDEVLFTAEIPDGTPPEQQTRLALQAAVKSAANLCGAAGRG
jgi:hypothetical protein